MAGKEVDLSWDLTVSCAVPFHCEKKAEFPAKFQFAKLLLIFPKMMLLSSTMYSFLLDSG